MIDKKALIPPEDEPYFPKGSTTMLTVHIGIGLFLIMGYFALYSNIQTFKLLILIYYTLFNVCFLFFYHRYLRVRRIYIIWLILGFIQLAIYIINANSVLWAKWSFANVLSVLMGLPVTLVLYQWFRRMSFQKEHKDLVIGIRSGSEPSIWDKAATIVIPLVTLLLSMF